MRIRTIKPEFWLNDDLARQSDFARLLALGLLNYSDDEGFFNASPELIRGLVFPYEKNSTRIQRALDDLSRIGFLRLSVGNIGRQYGQVIKFLKHQKIDRPTGSRIRELATFDELSPSPPRPLGDSSSPDQGSGIREQGSGKRASAGSVLPAEQSDPIHQRMIEVGCIFGRRPDTRWSTKEFTAFKTEAALHDMPEEVYTEQVRTVAGYYGAPAAQLAELWGRRDGGSNLRTTLLTLLNNWGGELDRARAWQHAVAKKIAVQEAGRL